ncbi:MAG: hypothetical protein U9N55_08180 [candidate division Zixibacteria bacterium]|nr:hypothetical protein [candidate division Zixibacteria bacterium]
MNDIKGSFITVNDNITADMICSSEYTNENNSAKLAKHVFEALDNGIPKKLANVSILIVGHGFGNGTVNDLPVRALLAAGVKCIIAISYNRRFFRAGINNGLALVECDLLNEVSNNGIISVNLAEGKITYRGKEIHFALYPEQVCKIIEAGGLLKAVKKQLWKT